MTTRLIPTPLPGVFVLRSEPARDARGSFMRLFCVSTLAAHGIVFSSRQTSLSHSALRGTLRGLHFQTAPSAEPRSSTASQARCSTWRSISGRTHQPSAARSAAN